MCENLRKLRIVVMVISVIMKCLDFERWLSSFYRNGMPLMHSDECCNELDAKDRPGSIDVIAL